jgi:hypothetical protein
MNRSIAFHLLVTAVLALASAWLWHSRESERQSSQELLQRFNDLEQRLRTDQAGVTPAPAAALDIPALKASTDPSPVSPVTGLSPRETEVREHLRSMAQRQREMLRDPAYRQLQVDAGRRQFARTRSDAIRVVGMTPQQADRVIDLWVKRNLRYQELSPGIPGETPNEAGQVELKRAGDAEQAELRVLLGQETYEKWGRYLASGEERAEVGQLREQLADNDPLREAQADALVDTIYLERGRRSREYDDYVKSMGIADRNIVTAPDRQRWLDLEKEANQRIHAAAAGSLSRSQLASLDDMLAARLAPVEYALRQQLEGKVAKSN